MAILVICYVLFGLILFINSEGFEEFLHPRHSNFRYIFGEFLGLIGILIFYPVIIIAAKLKAVYDVFFKKGE